MDPRARIDRLRIVLPSGWRGDARAFATAFRRELERAGMAAARDWAEGGPVRVTARPDDTPETLARRMLRPRGERT